MSRNQDSIYDFIVILDNKNYAGVVNIREFLIEMSKTKEREIKLLNAQQQILKETNLAEKRHRLEIEQKMPPLKIFWIMPARVYLSLLPSELVIQARHIQTEYKIIPHQTGKSIMMILTDATQKKALELKTAEEKK